MGYGLRDLQDPSRFWLHTALSLYHPPQKYIQTDTASSGIGGASTVSPELQRIMNLMQTLLEEATTQRTGQQQVSDVTKAKLSKQPPSNKEGSGGPAPDPKATSEVPSAVQNDLAENEAEDEQPETENAPAEIKTNVAQGSVQNNSEKATPTSPKESSAEEQKMEAEEATDEARCAQEEAQQEALENSPGNLAIQAKSESLTPPAEGNSLKKSSNSALQQPLSSQFGNPPNPIQPNTLATANTGAPANESALNARAQNAQTRDEKIQIAVEASKLAFPGDPVRQQLLVAQLIHESGWTNSDPSKRSSLLRENNFFGIKASGTKGTAQRNDKEFTAGGQAYFANSNFASNNTFMDSVYQYRDLIKNSGRYAGVRSAGNFQGAAAAVKAGGYATDPNYVQKLVDVFNVFGLGKYTWG